MKEVEVGMLVKELCRKYGFSDVLFYIWCVKFGGMEVLEVCWFKNFEVENVWLKKLLVEVMFDMEVLKVVVKGKF